MPDVFIDSLTLEDFGPFYGEHTFILSNLEERTGILIGGKNGTGKTHLLRALYLAIVGEIGKGDLKRVETDSDATRFIFDKALNRKAQSEGKDTVKLSVKITQVDNLSGGSRDIVFNRNIRYRPNSAPVWQSTAIRSDVKDIIDNQKEIDRLRDAFLPRHLARFFLFDAERSQSINLGQQDIIEGVTRILGLWTYSELEDDLRQLIKLKIPRIYSTSSGQDPETKLVDLNAEVVRNEGHVKAHRKEINVLEITLRESEAELLEVEDSLRTLGAVDPEELENAQNRRNELIKTKNELEYKITESWELSIPIGLLGEYRNILNEYLESEERRREWESAKSSVEPKIPQVKEDIFGNVPDEFKLKPNIESFYIERLEYALHRIFHPPPEGIPDSVFVTDRNETSIKIRSILSEKFADIRDLTQQCIDFENMDVELRELDQRLKQMQQNKASYKRGMELHQKRGELIEKNEHIRKRLRELRVEIEAFESRLSELKREETNQREICDKVQKGESLIAIAAKYREAAAEIRQRTAIQMRNSISELVGEMWVDITDRKHEFKGMEFDNYWNCILLRKDGKKVTWEETNTSAGQRQVRMLAFYEALRRLARLVPPLVVDTPLARLDKEIRANVLDQLYLNGHQSVILTTNSEIDPDGILFDKIRNRVARVYTLHSYGKPNSIDYETRVSGDYFGKGL